MENGALFACRSDRVNGVENSILFYRPSDKTWLPRQYPKGIWMVDMPRGEEIEGKHTESNMKQIIIIIGLLNLSRADLRLLSKCMSNCISPRYVKAIAMGSKWAAAATSRQYVRVFSSSGVQLSVFSLPGPAVCMAGSKNLLAIAYHRIMPVKGTLALSLLSLSIIGLYFLFI